VNAFGSLHFHWPEYLMEAGELALYMFVTCALATLLQHPASPVRHLDRQRLLSPGTYGIRHGCNRRRNYHLTMGVSSLGLISIPV
jgi:aquaporin Z